MDLSLTGTLYLYRHLGKKLETASAAAGRKLKIDPKRSPSEKWQIKLGEGYASHKASALANVGILCV
jgi:hypothetical protein